MPIEYNIVKRAASYTRFLPAVFFYALTSHAASNSEYQNIDTLYKQGQYAQALDKDNAYIAKNPKDAQACFLKGLILTEQNKPSEAIAVFTKLTEDFPELPEPYNNLAVLYAAQGNYDKARNALEMAIHTHPSYAIAHENLGDIYAKMASIAYDKALQLDNKNNTVHTKLELIKTIFSDQPKLPTECNGVQPPVTVQHPNSPSTAAVNADHAITDAVLAWAKAWSEQKPTAYLAMYAPQFQPPNDQTRSQWETMRRNRISKPKQISVQLTNLHVDQSDDHHATVGFIQTYHSDTLSASNQKQLHMVQIHGDWLIEQELTR